jgi:DNA polymerase-3 subunit epsilon
MDRTSDSGKKLYLLIDRGVFWGMGYVDESTDVRSVEDLKSNIDRFPDNDFIRTSIYNYAELNPDCKLLLS